MDQITHYNQVNIDGETFGVDVQLGITNQWRSIAIGNRSLFQLDYGSLAEKYTFVSVTVKNIKCQEKRGSMYCTHTWSDSHACPSHHKNGNKPFRYMEKIKKHNMTKGSITFYCAGDNCSNPSHYGDTFSAAKRLAIWVQVCVKNAFGVKMVDALLYSGSFTIRKYRHAFKLQERVVKSAKTLEIMDLETEFVRTLFPKEDTDTLLSALSDSSERTREKEEEEKNVYKQICDKIKTHTLMVSTTKDLYYC